MLVPDAFLCPKVVCGNRFRPLKLYCVVTMPVISYRLATLKASAIRSQRTRSDSLIARDRRRSTLLAPGPVNVLRPTVGKRVEPPSPSTPEVRPDGEGLPEMAPEWGRPSTRDRAPESWKPFPEARRRRASLRACWAMA